MEPITMGVMAGTALLSGLAQYHSSEKARKASQKQLDKIERIFNAIKPPDYDLSISDPPALHDQQLKLPKFSGPMGAPKFNLAALEPEDLKVVGKFNPELPALIKEVEPTIITKTEGMKAGRAAQLKALKEMQRIGDSAFDPEYQQRVQQAARSAQGEAQSRQASIMQDFARRGIAGSGLNLAAQLGGAADSMDRTAQINQQAATDAYRNRLNALMSGAQLGGQISAEDVTLQDRNSGIINDFNQRTSRNRQAYEDAKANALNAAQQMNLGVAQGIANQNTETRNKYNLIDRDRLDALAKYGAGFAQDERDRMDRNKQQSYQNAAGQREYLNSLAAGQAAWQAGEREKLNNLKSKGFQDQLAIAEGKSGIAGQRSNAATSAAADRNSLIQGLTNTAMAGGLAYGQQKSQDRAAYNQANNASMSSNKRFMTPAEKQQWEDNYYGG